MTSTRLNFTLEAEAAGSRARAATFRTSRGEVRTPLFMPVGTQATVKAQLTQTLEDAGSQILLANTYHLLIRPGPEVFRRVGGIHRFMSWPRSVLTDSGGFQIFSLPHSRAVDEGGAVFQSYHDGRTILLSPEVSIETQLAIGSDIMMVLDRCLPASADESEAQCAVETTHRWAARCLAARGEAPNALFAIVQGGVFHDLRRRSAAGLTELPFDGFAIGGLAVGESRREREDTCEFTVQWLPRDQPRYLMGVGTPLDILEAVHRGVDMFDCIMPTQLAQRGGVFTSRGFLQLRRGVYKYAEDVLDPACPCPTCTRYSRAYLHHLTKTGETLGWQLLGQHNLYFYHGLMREIRESILKDRFLELYHAKRPFLHAPDLDHPTQQVKPKRKRITCLGAYEVHTAPAGFASIRHITSGEIMHGRTPPLEEATRLYVEQAALAQRLQTDPRDEAADRTPLVVWDVGLGAAANAMAAIRCYEKVATADGAARPLQVISFENDLDALKLACKRNDLFPYLRHSGPAGILARGEWQSKDHPGLEWRLITGDFRQTMSLAPSASEVIFYDLFSSEVNPGLWTLETFRCLFRACGALATVLFTYSSSTAVRTALLAAGFHVAKGRGTGQVRETTIALTPAALGSLAGRDHELLSLDWLERWNRSSARYASDVVPEQYAWFEQTIREHPQFVHG